MINNNGIIIPVFPEAVLYIQKINIDSNKIINYLKSLKFIHTESTLNGNANCYISKNLNLFNDLPFLKKEINKHIDFYLHKIFLYKMNYKFTTSWATKSNFKGYGQKHSHSNCFLSGVYYPIGNKNFKIKFYKKHSNIWCVKKEKFNEFNARDLTFNIINDNTLILFPSDLNHSIENNEENIERYSIAFNINPKGFIGESDSEIEF
jgi:uncharacterized protein (TIGR02466 family)